MRRHIFIPQKISSTIPVISGYSFYVDSANTSSYPGSGTVWTDLSGSGVTVTLVGSPTFNPTDAGGSLEFNGINQYGTFGYNSIFNLSGSSGYVMETWVKLNSFSNAIPFSMGLYGSTFDWGYIFSTSTSYTMYSDGTAQSVAVSLGTPLNSGQWYHLVATGDSTSTTYIYVNGVLVASGSLTISNSSSSYPSPVGEVGGYGPNVILTPYSSINGGIGIARLYQFNLTATQVLQNFNADKTRFGY